MDELRVINFLDSLIAFALSMLVPLLLLSRGVDVVSIGLIVSLSPVIFVISRGIFAAISDQVGVRRAFIFNGVMNVVVVGVYIVANNTLVFSIGKMLEGLRSGAMWAVNRTAILMKNSGKKAIAESTRTQGIRTAAAALGIVAAGVLLAKYSFEETLVFFGFLGVVLLSLSFLVESKGERKVKMKEVLGQLDFRKRNDFLKKTSLVGIPQSVAATIPLSLLFPLYLNSIGFSYWLIGIAIASYYMVSAATTLLFVRFEWGEKVVWIGALSFLAGGILLPFLGGEWAIPLMMIMGIGDGAANPLWETLVFNSLRSGRDASSDVALLHSPSNLSNSVGLILAGIVVSQWGYGVVFVSCGILFALSFYLCLELLKESKYRL
jgi:predicted MFS family arabinose efflux permease